MNNDAYVLVPLCLLDHLGDVSIVALKTYLTICSLVGPDGKPPSPSTAQLAKLTGLTRRSVFAALSYLEQRGLIKRAKNARSATNEYSLLLPDDTVHHPGSSPHNGGTPPASEYVVDPPSDAAVNMDSAAERVVRGDPQTRPESIDDLIKMRLSRSVRQPVKTLLTV
jgi:hypothetical protein